VKKVSFVALSQPVPIVQISGKAAGRVTSAVASAEAAGPSCGSVPRLG